MHMNRIFLTGILLTSFIIFSGWLLPQEDQLPVDGNTSVWDVLSRLGETPPNHLLDKSIKGVSAERGADIVFKGVTHAASGSKIKKQSKHFVCTSCHNTVQEDPDLSQPTPQDRLEYAKKKNIPYLQGTTLYGAVNRTSFYNGDYKKKYGDLVEPARKNLREAIQLCAVECSQGRRLKDWELESVLAYLWTIELKLQDLNMANSQYEEIDQTMKANVDGKAKKRIADLIKRRYLAASPAHFVSPPENRKKGVELKGDPENGKWIYDLSCQHCHKNKRYSQFSLDDSKFSFKHLKKHFPRYSRYSVYQVTRYGTQPLNGKRAYMPQYTIEKMNEQQLADLRAYVESRAIN